MLFGFIFLDSDEDPLPPKIRYMHAISIPLCTLLYLYIYMYSVLWYICLFKQSMCCNNIVLILQGGAKVLSYYWRASTVKLLWVTSVIIRLTSIFLCHMQCITYQGYEANEILIQSRNKFRLSTGWTWEQILDNTVEPRYFEAPREMKKSSK